MIVAVATVAASMTVEGTTAVAVLMIARMMWQV